MSRNFYKEAARYYDLLYSDSSANERTIGFISWAFENYTSKKVSKVLDCACGTGAQTMYLLEKEYDITASDYSPDMLEVARKKIRGKGFTCQTAVNDVRSLPYNNEFDALIFMFSAFNHLLTTDDARGALASMKNALVPGGIAVIDIANLVDLMPRFLKIVNDHSSTGGVRVMRNITHGIDSVRSVMTHREMSIIDDGEGIKSFAAETELRIFTKPELDMLIDSVDFSEVHFFRGYNDRGEKDGNTFRFVYVLVK
ncbi:MAG: methyltransferase domain-containing protein [candidate division Zixibacteria bacterium]|nr:methyltransferase domain-containing protein [candidate division Zixibacteria bacterium]